jgi:hypothetical protein
VNASGFLFVGAFAVGIAITVAAASRLRLSLWALTFVTVTVAVVGLAVFATTYRDEFCDENTACRLFSGPGLMMWSALAPGMGAGLVGVAFSRAAARRERERGDQAQ